MFKRAEFAWVFATILAMVMRATAAQGVRADPDAAPNSGRQADRVNIAGSESEVPIESAGIELTHLLLSRPVQREIDLSDEQADRINRILSDFGSRSRALLLEVRNQSDPERRADVWDRLSAVNDDIDERCRAVLSRQQLDRIDEIAIRNAGLRALQMPRVADTLRLTPGQRRNLASLIPPLRPMSMSDRDLQQRLERARPQLDRILTREHLSEFRLLVGGTSEGGEVTTP